MAMGYFYVICSMLANVVSQQFWGGAMSEAGVRHATGASWQDAGLALLSDLRIWVGGGFAGACIVFWALALTQLPISRALPVMALAFILSPLTAAVVLGESIRPLNVVGFVVVVVGVVLSSVR